MRRLLWSLVLCGATACTALNGAFEDVVGETDSGATDGGPSSASASGASSPAPSGSGSGTSSDPTVDPSESMSDGDPSGETDPSGPTDPSDPTDPTDTSVGTVTTDGTGSSESGAEGDGSTGTGMVPTDRVVFVYATVEPWFFVDNGAIAHCTEAQPKLAVDRCEGGLRVPLASTEAVSLQDAFASLEALDSLPVFGIGNDGTEQLAESPDAMLDGLDVTLAAAGVNLNPDTIFWTGAAGNCGNWTAEAGFGSAGVADSTESSWYDAVEAPCGGDSLRLLCACVSVEFPFE